MPQNFESDVPSDPERYSKKLSVGVVSTSPTEDTNGTEPQKLVEKRIESAVDRYSPDSLLVSPDCGFMPLGNLLGEEEGYQLSMRKIRALTMARRTVGIGIGVITDEKTAGD
jgi:methionine synthase II (cobalamin-independent)